MEPQLHPEVAHLAFLLGTWIGEGRGDYPTIEGFGYVEESTYGHVGKPFLVYSQKTRGADGQPLHAEVGYVRPVAIDGLELVLAHPSGITEIQSGTIEGESIRLRSITVGLAPTAKDVRALTRRIDVSGDSMRYVIEMAAVGQDMQFHLEANLLRRA